MQNYFAFFPAAFIFLALLSDAANFHYSKGMKFMTIQLWRNVKSSKNLKKKDSKKLIWMLEKYKYLWYSLISISAYQIKTPSFSGPMWHYFYHKTLLGYDSCSVFSNQCFFFFAFEVVKTLLWLVQRFMVWELEQGQDSDYPFCFYVASNVLDLVLVVLEMGLLQPFCILVLVM